MFARAGIVCAVDAAGGMDRTVEQARSLARDLHARLRVVSLAGRPSTEHLLDLVSSERPELLLLRAPPRAAFALGRRGRMFRELLRHAPCPVVAVPAGPEPTPRGCGNARNLVCGVEAGPHSPAVSVAAELAARLRLRPIAVHACDPSSRIALNRPASVAEDPIEDDVRHGWRLLSHTVDELGERAEARLVFDSPTRALQAVSARVQSRLIVVGFGRGGPVCSLWPGSVPMRIATAAAMPVVIVPSG
jgi:nucleotide-binding universal stress UspA family protein